MYEWLPIQDGYEISTETKMQLQKVLIEFNRAFMSPLVSQIIFSKRIFHKVLASKMKMLCNTLLAQTSLLNNFMHRVNVKAISRF